MIPVLGGGEEGAVTWREDIEALEIREREEQAAVPRARLRGTVGGNSEEG